MKLEPITHKSDSNNLEWNESYYLAFFSKEDNLGGVSRIGYKPNKKEGMTFFFSFCLMVLRQYIIKKIKLKIM